jgi:hypothetical protein
LLAQLGKIDENFRPLLDNPEIVFWQAAAMIISSCWGFWGIADQIKSKRAICRLTVGSLSGRQPRLAETAWRRED